MNCATSQMNSDSKKEIRKQTCVLSFEFTKEREILKKPKILKKFEKFWPNVMIFNFEQLIID